MGVDALMCLRVQRAAQPTDVELRDLSFAIRERLGRDADSLFPPMHSEWIDAPGPLLLAPEDEDDGLWSLGKGFWPGVRASSDDEWIVWVRVWCRYYGPGYERGPALGIVSVAEWCERNVRNDDGTPCKVLYGSDSGHAMEPFGPDRRAALVNYFYGPDGVDYHDRVGSWTKFEHPPTACQLCPSTGPRWFANNSRIGTCRGCMREFRLIEGEWTVTQQEK